MRVLCGLVTCAVLALVPAGRLAAAGTPSCTITWDGGSSGSWHTPSNWDPSRLPAPDDVVCIPAAMTVTHSSGTTAVATVLVDRTLALGSSTLSVTSTAAPSRIATLAQASGTLGGAATVLLTGSAANSSSWSGGSMAGPGTTRIASGASLTIIGSSARLLANGRSLENLGTVTWTGGVLHTVDGSRPRIVVGPGGLLDMSGDVHVLSSTASLHILNGGVLRKSAGGLTGSILAKTSNDGVVEALSGNLAFTVPMKSSGTMTVGEGAALGAPVINSTGLIRGSGTIQGQGDVIAGGEVAPGLSPGILTVSGDYHQQSDARLRVELAGTTPGTEYDRLVVTGPASLGSVLTIESAPGFLPPVGTTFEILSGTRAGQFASVEGDLLPNGNWYAPRYNPDNVQLVVQRGLSPRK
jgi:hypothetical protein